MEARKVGYREDYLGLVRGKGLNPSCWVFVKLGVIPSVDYYGGILEVMIYTALGEIGGGGLSAFHLSSLYISTTVVEMNEGMLSALK